MRARLISLTGLLIVGMAVLAGWTHVVSAQPSTSDFDAIQKVMERYVAAINSAEFAKAPQARRVEMLRPFYRPDSSFSKTDPPMFFGPLSEPMSRGVKDHLENTNLNFELLFRQGMTYGLRIDESQIELGTGMAAVFALTTSGYSSPDGKTDYVTRGRASIILNKIGPQWLISHEHLELYNSNNPSILSKQQLTAEIEKIKR